MPYVGHTHTLMHIHTHVHTHAYKTINYEEKDEWMK